MILQERDGELLMFRQTDHALLSGAFAAAWGNATVPAPDPPRSASVLAAAARHDDGWAEWELSPTVGEDGRPVDFIHIPVREHTTLYRRGIDLVEREDDYAGLVVSLHGERLYTRPFYPGMEPRIQHLQDDDRLLAESYVAHERERQDRLVAAVAEAGGCTEGDLRGAAEEVWRLLQVWDRLSLLVCMQPFDGASGTMPPIAVGGDDVRIEARGESPDVLRLDPYPFREEPFAFALEASVVPAGTWESVEAFRRAYRLARRQVVGFECRSA